MRCNPTRRQISVFSNKKIFIFLLGILCVLPGNIVLAATGVPEIISHQGRLLSSGGTLLGGASGTNYCFRFAFYDDATVGGGDVKLWPTGTPSTMTVNVKNGVFNVGIGDTSVGGDTLDFDFESNDSVYLNTEVGEQVAGSCGSASFENLSPRARIVSSGFAINASTLNGRASAQSADANEIVALTSDDLILGGTNPDIAASGSNTLTLQGAGATGNLQFFSSANSLSSTGNFDVAGALQSGSSNVALTLATGFLDADALTLTAAVDGGLGTSSGSGLIVRSDGIGLLQGCTDGQVLAWVEVTDTWDCSTAAGGSGDITSVGNVASGAAFDGTQGTILTFNDADGDQTLAYDTTNNEFDISDDVNIAGTLVTSGGLTIDATTESNIESALDTLSSVTTVGALNAGSITSGFGAIDVGADNITTTGIVSTDTLTFTNTGTLNGLDVIDSTSETTLEGALDIVGDVDGTGLGSVDLDEAAVETELESVIDLQDLQGAVIDSQVPNTITIDSATTAGTVTFADAGGDTTTFVALGTSATGSLAPATDAGLSYNATSNALTATTFIGGLTGNVTGDVAGNLTGNVTGNADTASDLTCTNCIGPTEITDLTLGTDTAGNYVATVAGGAGLTGSGSSEGSTPTLAVVSGNGAIVVNADDITLTVAPSANGLSANTSSGSGLEVVSTGLALLQGCADTEVLKWNESTDVWECGTAGGGSGDITSVGDVASGAAFDGTAGTTLTFNDADGDKTLKYDTTNNWFEFNDNLALGSAGVLMTDDGDGAITFLSLGNGSGGLEDLTLNFDDTANQVVLSSSTGVTDIDFGTIDINSDTLDLTGTGTLNGLDAIDATGETTLETTLDLQDVSGAVTDSQVPNNITVDTSALASTVTVVDGTDSTSFVAIFDSATGSLAAKTDGGLLYDASNGTLSATILSTPTLTLTGTGTLNGLDAIDSTTEDTIEAALDTLANLTSIQGNTVTLTGDFIRSGAHGLTLTTTGTTNVTLPTTGTLATLAGTETLSGKTLTAPKFADLGFLADANGNEILTLDTITSAVNELTLANAATGNAVTISTTGGDTNIGLNFTPKGSGTVQVNGDNVMDECIVVAVGDEYSNMTAGTNKAIFRMPFAMTVRSVRASVVTAPTGSVATWDINDGGTTILSTKLTIDASEKTSTTAATPAVISDTALADDAEISIDRDGVGSTVTGAGDEISICGSKDI